jgi:two-component system response regulator LytT
VARYQPPAPAVAPAADETHLLLKEQGSLLKVLYRDILYVEGCKDYVKIVTAAKTYLHHATMKEMVDTLGERFVRVQRSFIVAAAHIKLLQPEQLVLTTGDEIPIGNSYKAEVLAFFKK